CDLQQRTDDGSDKVCRPWRALRAIAMQNRGWGCRWDTQRPRIDNACGFPGRLGVHLSFATSRTALRRGRAQKKAESGRDRKAAGNTSQSYPYNYWIEALPSMTRAGD